MEAGEHFDVRIEPPEYRNRIAKLARSLRSEGLDGALLTAESNIDYFSGFRHHAPWSLFARPFFEVIDADGRTVLVIHAFLEPEARRTASVDDIRSFTQSGGAPIAMLQDVLAELGIKRGRLGMELGHEQRLGVSIEDFRRLEALPGIAIADLSHLIWRLRMIKSAAELALLTRSAQITAEAFRTCFEVAQPGMTEAEVARIAAARMIDLGAERPGFILITSGKGNYGVLSGKPTGRKLQKDEMLWIDMGAIYKGYWSDFCRAAVLGKPSPKLDSGQNIIREVNQACIEAAQIGATMRHVAAAGEAALRKNGIDIRLGHTRIGHGIGLMSTEPPHVALYDDTLCKEGLVFTIEPRFVTEDAVFNCEELVVVTTSGARLLTSASRNLHYII